MADCSARTLARRVHTHVNARNSFKGVRKRANTALRSVRYLFSSVMVVPPTAVLWTGANPWPRKWSAAAISSVLVV
jgi:hypothetical protein